MAEVFDMAAYVSDFFYPCVAIGVILPAGAAVLSALVRAGFRLLGIVVDD